MELISVVVPAYNCENTIERCLKSVLNQTYRSLQVIVVNDGSTDNTESVVKRIQNEDSRVKMVSTPNCGVSHARNIGIETAEGEYIAFLDADDFIDSTMYESLVSLIQKHQVQIAHCSYKNVNENGEIISIVGNTGKILQQGHDEAIECFLTDRLFCEALWNKLYSKDLFDTVRLNEDLRINEDVLANFQLFKSVEKSVFYDRSFYSYVDNSHSVTHSESGGLFSAEQALTVAKMIYQLSVGESYELLAKRKVAVKALNLYKEFVRCENDKTIIEKTVLLKNEIKGYKSLYLRKNDKIAYCLLMYFPRFFKLIYRRYEKIRVKKLDPIQ